MNQCGNCKFFQMNLQDMNEGSCRRYPPNSQFVPTKDGPMPVAAQPPVWREDWCGEHQPKVQVVQ